MANALAAARFAELPVPDTTEEAWRFTDLKGFDPSLFETRPVPGEVTKVEQMLDLEQPAVPCPAAVL